jgi:serine protease inhibitor ecotin
VPGGFYYPGEHIGHISRQYSALTAPIFDECEEGTCELSCHLIYADSNHSKVGFKVAIILRCTLNVECNDHIFCNSLPQ